MNIGDLFLACHNIHRDTLFKVYNHYDFYRDGLFPVAVGDYDVLSIEICNKPIQNFFIDESLDVVKVLIAE